MLFRSLQNGEYSSYPITKNSYFSLYDSIIYPEILMDLMLNRIDIKNMIDISILESKDYYQVLATKEQWQVKAKIEKNRHIITEIFWHKINAKLQYHVFYDNFSIVNGIYFPHEMVFKTVNIDKSSSFKFLLNEVILNEPYQDEGIFYLKAPQ